MCARKSACPSWEFLRGAGRQSGHHRPLTLLPQPQKKGDFSLIQRRFDFDRGIDAEESLLRAAGNPSLLSLVRMYPLLGRTI
jgi:hypothetical protein